MNTTNEKQHFLETQKFYNRLLKDGDHYGAEKYVHGWAGNFHRYRIGLLRKIFVNDLGCKKETEILDIGSGVSMLGEIFNPKECPKVTSFDISDIVIDKAKKKYPHINYLVDDAQNPSLKGKWDILFAGEVIEHLPLPKEALQNWSKLIKEGGFLVLSTPNSVFSRKNEEHISLLSIRGAKKILRDSNFKILDVVGIDLFNPILDVALQKIAKYVPGIAGFCDNIFQIKMRLAKKIPWLANDVIYVARKK